MRSIGLIFFLLFVSIAANAQLKEFEISPLPKPEISLVQANTEFGEDALIIIYSSLTNLNFRSSMGMIDKQSYNQQSNRYEILLRPVKQILLVFSNGFMEGTISTINPKSKDVFYFKVEEKKTALLNQTLPGKLTINSNPAGANISLNGISITNKTPFTGELNPGPTRIQLSKTKYQTFDTILNIQSSINEVLTVNLKPLENLADDFHVDGIVKDASGNSYKTVKIGNQIWMAENLKTERYANGDLIPNVKGDSNWSNINTGGWCNYDNSKQNDEIYGKLYNWYAAADSRNVCPNGWHVPLYEEWVLLIDNLGGKELAGSKMKSNGPPHWYQPNNDAINLSGFSGLAGGDRSCHGKFYKIGEFGYWWISSEYDSVYSWYGYLNNKDNDAAQFTNYKHTGLSVRCLKD